LFFCTLWDGDNHRTLQPQLFLNSCINSQPATVQIEQGLWIQELTRCCNGVTGRRIRKLSGSRIFAWQDQTGAPIRPAGRKYLGTEHAMVLKKRLTLITIQMQNFFVDSGVWQVSSGHLRSPIDNNAANGSCGV